MSERHRRPAIIAALATIIAAGCLFRSVPQAGIYCDDTQPCNNGKVCEQNLCVNGDGGTTDGDVDMTPECTMTSQCIDPTKPLCLENTCRGCDKAATPDDACNALNTTTPRCQLTTGACVPCIGNSVEDAKCAAATPVCQNNACRKCTEHEECTSGICATNGTCVAETNIFYVDNANGACVIGSQTGDRTNKMCQVETAINAGGREYILVSASNTAYNSIVVQGGRKVTVVGPLLPSVAMIGDLPLPGPSGMASDDKPATAYVTGSGSELSLDRLELNNTQAGERGASCESALGIHLRRVHASGATTSAFGVYASQCSLSMDSSSVIGFGSGGISLSFSPSFSVTNSIIAKNGDGTVAGAGVVIANGSTGGVFSHNTIWNNAFNSTESGINCGEQTDIANSIIWSNNGLGGAQVTSQCQCTYVDASGPSLPPGTGNRSVVPSFRSTMTPYDLRLNGHAGNNDTCCIDQIDVPSPLSPPFDHDIDGNKRPFGAKLDIGAHEVQE